MLGLKSKLKVILNFAVIILFSAGVLFFANYAYAANDHLWINQVQVEGDGGSNDEFIEIYNPTDAAVSLSGWSIQYKSANGDFPLANSSQKKNLPDVEIPSLGYFLFANTGYNGSIAADHTQSAISLSGTSTGATIFLVHLTSYITSAADSGVVDKLAYGSSSNNSAETANAPTPASEKSLLRNGTDSDNNSTDFTVVDSNPHNLASSPSAPVLPEPPLAPPPSLYSNQIIISEFLPNPPSTDSGHEWIELYNNSTETIDLSGWILDDEATDNSIGSSAYTIPAGATIAALGFLTINLPGGSFALDNSGGDTVRLFWPDRQLAKSVVYTGTAAENESYALKIDGSYIFTKLLTPGAANQFEQPPSTGESGSQITELEKFDPNFLNIRISEIYPNPPGPDSGREWIEVTNIGTEPISMHGWIVADGADGAKISASAWTIESPTVSAGGSALLEIPSGRFALNNTGAETVRLFAPNLEVIDFVSYEEASEGRSYSLIDGSWVWSIPTPGEENIFVQGELESTQDPDVVVILSEVLPEPLPDREEFIELYNPNEFALNLSGWTLSDAVTKYKIKSLVIDPLDFAVIYKSESKIALNNFGRETVQLLDEQGNVVWALELEDAPKNQSFNWDGESYRWSSITTPGKPNQIKLKAEGSVKGQNIQAIVSPLEADEPISTAEFPETIVPFTPATAQAAESSSATVNSSGTPLATGIIWSLSGFVLGAISCYSIFRIRKKRGQLL